MTSALGRMCRVQRDAILTLSHFRLTCAPRVRQGSIRNLMTGRDLENKEPALSAEHHTVLSITQS